MIPHYRETLIAVKILSPVAIIFLTPAYFKTLIISLEIGFSLFSIIKNPIKFKFFSIVSRSNRNRLR